ncbi:MAG: hypothetical protein QOG54_2316 [Actinomycetota bacterium]|jgi:hypothetical protein|nr:hypothetical protein [Actinomycetota bacterium]
MADNERDQELTPEGIARIEAVDAYLVDSIRAGEPIEALIATRRLGEIASARAKEAAQVATEGRWSWSDIGTALGMTKQAAHEKLRARAHNEIAKGLAKVDEAERTGRAKVTRRANRGREGLDRAAPFSPKVDSARERIDEWEQKQNEKLTRKIEKARRTVAESEKSVLNNLDRKTSERPPSDSTSTKTQHDKRV